MGFLQDWFSGEVKKAYEPAERRAQTFQDTLESHVQHMNDERKYANMQPAKKKVPFADLDFHPLYEQRNKMFEHKQFTRRPAEER